MSDVGGVQGGGEPQKYTKEELENYQRVYKKGLDLFQKSFEEYNQPNVEFHKKEQLKKVMDEALQVMNETACVALKEGKMADEKKLNEHYQAFIADPSDKNNQQAVANDIKSLQE